MTIRYSVGSGPAPQCNCYTISYTAPFSQGVPVRRNVHLTHHNRRRCVSLGDGRHIYVTHDPRNEPLCSHERGGSLVRAKLSPLERAGSFELVRCEAGERIILVRIIPNSLKFEFGPLASGLNLWPGGDGIIEPVLQGRGDRPEKFYELREGQSIFVLDENKAAARIVCQSGRLAIGQATVEQLTAFMVERAQTKKIIPAIDWALYNLEALQKAHPRHSSVREAIGTLVRLRAQVR